MTSFDFEPFVGPLPVNFGMTWKMVKALVGPAVEVSESPFGDRIERRPDLGLNLGYEATSGELFEAVFTPSPSLRYRGTELFQIPDLIVHLRSMGSEPQLCLGFVVFRSIGLRLSGFHDRDESQKAIGLTKQGYWDDFADDLKPFPRKNTLPTKKPTRKRTGGE